MDEEEIIQLDSIDAFNMESLTVSLIDCPRPVMDRDHQDHIAFPKQHRRDIMCDASKIDMPKWPNFSKKHRKISSS